jgi:hypothetical protein
MDADADQTRSAVARGVPGPAEGREGAVESGLIRLRVRPGCGGERARVVHLALFPDGVDESGEVLRTLCATGIRRGEAERVFGIVGMPCEPCIARLTQIQAPG